MTRPDLALLLAIALSLGPQFAASQAVLDVVGGDEDLSQALGAASVLMREREAATPTSDTVAAARAEYSRLLSVLYAEGYFAGVISVRIDGREAAQMSPFTAPGQIGEITIRVDPGPPFTLGAAQIGPLAPGDLAADSFATGAPASTGVLREAAGSAIDAWRDAGHATADVSDQTIRAQNRTATLDATIQIDPGPILQFGDLVPTGQDRMPASRVTEIAGLPGGALFSPAELSRAADRLRRTGVFSSVALREGAVRSDGRIDIDAELVEAPLRRLGFGAELSSTEGLALSGYWLHRNLTGGGERLRFDVEIIGIGQDAGQPDANIGVSFSRPATATPDTTFQAELGASYVDDDTFQELVVEGQAGVEQQITDELTGSAALGFRFSDISDNFGDRQVTLVTLPSGLTYDTRNNTLDASSGIYASLDLVPFFVTDSSEFGARAAADIRGYLGFGREDRTRLAGRLQFGTVTGGAITDLPPGYLFFSGGGGTVRGQDYRGLGAIQLGEASGGRSFLGLSGELRQDVTDTIGLVAFYDSGYIAADPIWDDSGTWHAGAGLGLRYATPIGAIRLDLAAPVSGPDPDSDFFVYIGIGQAF
ncbi:MAG: BamA/TamA family outer membrane protein [Pseudomonadota bacterium]